MARLARVMVSSSRSTTSPARTRWPSRTSSSPTIPPVRCCTFLTLESTTIDPGAITAPDSSVVVAQPPTPTVSSKAMTTPPRRWRRMERAFVASDVLFHGVHPLVSRNDFE